MIGMTFNLDGGVWRWSGGRAGGLAVNTWHRTQPGRLMVLTASGQWLGIRGCNWVEPKYGHSRQLLIAGANHKPPSLPRFQLFATSGKDTWISNALKKLLEDSALDYFYWLLDNITVKLPPSTQYIVCIRQVSVAYLFRYTKKLCILMINWFRILYHVTAIFLARPLILAYHLLPSSLLSYCKINVKCL